MAPATPARLRPARGPDDFPGIVAADNAAAAADGFDPEETVTVLAHRLEHLHDFDPTRDLCVAEVGGEIVGYARAHWQDEVSSGDRVYMHIGCVAPRWRRRGVGIALLTWARDRLAAVAAGHETERRRVWLSYVAEADGGGRVMLERLGYAVAGRIADMVRPHLDEIPDASLPDGLEVRPVRDEHLRAVWEAYVETFADHPGARVRTEADFRKFLADPVQDPSLWRVAWDGDQIAGQVLSFIDREENEQFDRRRGYTEGIATRRPWRRRGVARALLCQSLAAVRDAGMTEAALAVHLANPRDALRLYESVGFEVRAVLREYRRPFE